MKPKLPLAIVAGVLAALVGAVLWAAITVATNHQIGFMAIGVGLLVGFAVAKLGAGSGATFGLVGAVCALLGCVLGSFFAGVGFLSNELGESYFTVLSRFDGRMVVELLKETFDGMDLLFYGIAVYEGFKLGSRDMTGRVTAPESASGAA